MATRGLDPRRLDVAALATDAAQLDGQCDAQELARWRDMQAPPNGTALPPVRWLARGEQRTRGGEPPQIWLHLQVHALGWATCQRCLQPFSTPFEIGRTFRFVASEGEAEALDPDSEEDVLALTPAFDLLALIEDELLLAWPLVPRHERCSPPGHGAVDPAADPGPFAALAAWKARADKP